MKKLVITLLLILALVSTDYLLAQGPPGDSGPPAPPGDGNVNDISITPFLWILALAGAYLGFKKAK